MSHFLSCISRLCRKKRAEELPHLVLSDLACLYYYRGSTWRIGASQAPVCGVLCASASCAKPAGRTVDLCPDVRPLPHGITGQLRAVSILQYAKPAGRTVGLCPGARPLPHGKRGTHEPLAPQQTWNSDTCYGMHWESVATAPARARAAPDRCVRVVRPSGGRVALRRSRPDTFDQSVQSHCISCSGLPMALEWCAW